jgi:trigger factor
MSAESLKNGIQIEWKDLAPCSRRAEYLVSKDIIDKEFAEALKEVAKQAQLPGFRKGKAPLPLIRSRFGEIIVEDVAIAHPGRRLREGHRGQGRRHRRHRPEEAPAMPKQGEDYKFFFTFDVVPEIKLPEYKGMKVDAPKTEPVEERLAKRLQ